MFAARKNENGLKKWKKLLRKKYMFDEKVVNYK
jgi:hypothetical protein